MSTGIYIHLPFCRAHCTYCPFAVSTDHALEADYVDALLAELAMRSPAARERVDTIFIGGGTPSMTSSSRLGRILDDVRQRFAVDDDAELSMESNPEDVSPVAIAAWRALGVNRLSIGVQSFHDAELYPLGRGHASARARQAVTDAVQSGIRTSLDLILGLPGQTAASFRATLQTGIELGAGHLSLYMLDLEEGTMLERQVERGRVQLPEDSSTADLYVEAITTLEVAGLHQYEISNFARPGEECRHNVRYWKRESYFGFGLGAHSFIGEERRGNQRDLRQYIDQIRNGHDPVDFREQLGESERKREAIFLGLRQTTGLDCQRLIELCGAEGMEWARQGLESGWLQRKGDRFAFTARGFLFSNEYISQLF